MTATALSRLTATRGVGHNITFFRLFMPYLYQRVEVAGRKHAFLPLNRNYKPLGVRGGEHVSYPDHAPTHAVYFTRDPATFKNVWWNVNGGCLWLYDDSAASRRHYFARLERLLLRQVEMVA